MCFMPHFVRLSEAIHTTPGPCPLCGEDMIEVTPAMLATAQADALAAEVREVKKDGPDETP
jgi:hypothetical protein